jgi:hypothetical protein
LTVFIAELSQLALWGTNVGNAYLEAKTKEKVYIIPGGEFGALAGHTLIIVKALYSCDHLAYVGINALPMLCDL